ncbi:hypothetical protein [Bradyrhizobium lablabi]|uniref:hypothetical protein n=1 Tax=Bradyrhizobium lablabi TaxID=722472 RepID=UPI001BAD44F1|nr:hypothetical protein [Bradyrhizobium lablabi]MBR0695531.1 hypothetical protein [Bradyrhizobium lablabi]
MSGIVIVLLLILVALILFVLGACPSGARWHEWPPRGDQPLKLGYGFANLTK